MPLRLICIDLSVPATVPQARKQVGFNQAAGTKAIAAVGAAVEERCCVCVRVRCHPVVSAVHLPWFHSHQLFPRTARVPSSHLLNMPRAPAPAHAAVCPLGCRPITGAYFT
jgi:hypothetical protein